jgi:Fe-S oxidoreductase
MERFETLRKSTRAALCVACGKCSTMCPLAPADDFSTRRIVHRELEQHEMDPGVGLYRCLTCGSCETRCPQGVRVSELTRGLREMLPSQNRRDVPHGGILQATARLQTEGVGPLGRPSWLTDELRVAEEGDTALFVGCLPVFDRYFEPTLGIRTVEIARAAVALLNRMGIEPVVVEDEVCCGHDLLWAGDRESFAKLARANVEAFTRRKVQRVITTCAECCRTWRLDYPDEVDASMPRVQHMSEFLAERVDGNGSTFRAREALEVTFQDACRLGRHLNVYEAPRTALRSVSGLDLVEMPRSGPDALCCGTSGFVHCDAQSRRLQEERLQSARNTGASQLVTSCPKCLIHFSCAMAEDEKKNGKKSLDIEVKDFTVLMASMWEDRHEPNPSPPLREGTIGEST